MQRLRVCHVFGVDKASLPRNLTAVAFGYERQGIHMRVIIMLEAVCHLIGSSNITAAPVITGH